jgi:hypothetical protein
MQLLPPALRIRGAQLLLFLLALATPTLGAANAEAQTQPSSSAIRAVRIEGGVHLDGVLDEPVWATSDRTSGFTQRELQEGAPATERTEVAVLFDSEALYVGFWGYDSQPDRIVANRMQQDFSSNAEDCFKIIIDTYDDHRTGYLFVTNPNGALSDALITDNGRRSNTDWDGIWEVAARVTAEGWFAEIRIPFATLKFPTGDRQTWRINFERDIGRKREQDLWQGWSRNHILEHVSQAGVLEGIEGVSSGNLIDLRPFALAGTDKASGGSGKSTADFGINASYLPTPTIKLNFAINPDFAQVESDRAQVNLSRFSITYPEKRDFFLEGQEFFDFSLGGDIRPFYSRRIGIAADRTEIPILGGARVLGRQGGTTLGALMLQTSGRGEEPGANFGVVRIRRDIFEQSSVGMLLTSRIVPGGTDLTYGADFRVATSKILGGRNLEAGGAIAGTRNTTSEATNGLAEHLYVSYPNDAVEFDASWERAGRDFDPGVGFLRRRAYQKYYIELQLNPRPSFIPWIQKAEVKPLDVKYYLDDITGEMQTISSEWRPFGFTTRSGESFTLNIQRNAEKLTEPFEILKGSEIPAGTYWFSRYELEAGTFSGRAVSVRLGLSGGGFYSGTRTHWSAEASWRASRYLSLSGDLQQDLLTFEDDHRRVEDVGGRAEFALSPKLFGAVGAQWNSEDKQGIVNLRVNWIPKPGADLFLVVNQEADTDSGRWSPQRSAFITKFIWRIAF